MSLIILMGTFCCLLFCIWLLHRRQDVVQAMILPNVKAASASYGTKEDVFESPSDSEVIQLAEPTLETLVDLTATVDVSTVLAAQQGYTGDRQNEGRSEQRTAGDDNQADIIPAFERWELLFAAASRQAYAQQLDFYKMELGAFGGGMPGLDYASDLSTIPQRRHEPKPSLEQRLYFSWRMATPLAGYEQQLLRAAKISVNGREIVKFVPQKLEKRLQTIELEYAQTKGFQTVQSIAKTVFESQSTRDGYQFRVIRQRYR